MQDLVGTDGVMTVRFRFQLLALMGLNAIAAFAAESLSGGLVALILSFRPPPIVQLLYTSPPKSGFRNGNGEQLDQTSIELRRL